MICIFDVNTNRKILEANRNTYTNPILHPTRIMECHDFFYLSEGSWSVSIEDEIIYAKKDSVVILPAGVAHHGVNKCQTGTRTLFLHAAVANGDGYSDGSTTEAKENKKFLKNYIDASKRPMIKKCFENIMASYAKKEDLRASAWFSLLLCELYEETHVKDTNSVLAYKIKDIIDTDLGSAISNRYLADAIGKSIKATENIFKKTFNITIHSYIISERLKKAKYCLENFPDMPIASISESLGFYDEFHFSRQFKQKYGVSPSNFRTSSLKEEFVSCK